MPSRPTKRPSLVGSFQSHHVCPRSRTKYIRGPMHRPTSFLLLPTASLSQLHFQWHARATPSIAEPIQCGLVKFSSGLFDSLGGKQGVQQSTKSGRTRAHEARVAFDAVWPPPPLLLLVLVLTRRKRMPSSFW
ncbi:hypothetical protein V8C35DRAFT_296019 [Trichoderma chlorosporum]